MVDDLIERVIEACAILSERNICYYKDKARAYPSEESWWRARWLEADDIATAIRALDRTQFTNAAAPSIAERTGVPAFDYASRSGRMMAWEQGAIADAAAPSGMPEEPLWLLLAGSTNDLSSREIEILKYADKLRAYALSLEKERTR